MLTLMIKSQMIKRLMIKSLRYINYSVVHAQC